MSEKEKRQEKKVSGSETRFCEKVDKISRASAGPKGGEMTHSQPAAGADPAGASFCAREPCTRGPAPLDRHERRSALWSCRWYRNEIPT